MEEGGITLEQLSLWFGSTLSPLPEPRRRAEAELARAADLPGFSLAVLRLVAEPAADDHVRHAAAVHFKNLLRTRWSPRGESPPNPIPPPDKDQIKAVLVGFMLASPPRVQSQLSEALAAVSAHDFPRGWPALLPELVASLRSAAADYRAVVGLLGAANAIFKKFRSAFGSDTDTRLDLKYCLDGFAAPLLEIFLKTARLIDSSAEPAVLRLMFEAQRLCCRIFLSLNSVELPEFFEDHMKEWMAEFKHYLAAAFAPPLEADGTVDALRAAVCENLQLYMRINEEEFQSYLPDFVSVVYNLLTTPSPGRERLVVAAIRFLTTVSTSVHHGLFGSPDVLPRVCRSVVFPNVKAGDEDDELFEMNHVEFIRRDIEGSDADTRRRIACELLKGIAVNYKEQVMAITSEQIERFLASYQANPAENFKDKDAAIYLVVSLANVGHLINTESFFAAAIVPELKAADVNAAPLLKAGALKFFTVFRSQIPKQTAVLLLPDLIRFLGAESNVVHSYAANCIEKLLTVRDGGLLRYTAADVGPFLLPLMTNLFNALRFPESQENPYVMKCITRVLSIAEIGNDVVLPAVQGLVSVLGEVCKNPKDPVFNHYLFEAIAALIRRTCDKDPSLVRVFEENLFPALQNILAKDISEFWPYAFQIFSQLVDINPPPLSPTYLQLFEVLLRADPWTRPASVPALVRLLRSYLRKVPGELNREGRLSSVLGIFKSLVSVSSTEEQGFFVINTVIENLQHEFLAPYLGHVWSVLFTRLQARQAVRFVKLLIIFMSLVLVKLGPAVLVDSINSVQGNLFTTLVEKFWVPHLKQITGFLEVKLTAYASTRLLCEYPVFLDGAAGEVCGKMVDSLITLLSRPEEERVEEEIDVAAGVGGVSGHSFAFARLQNAGKKDEDPLADVVKDSKQFFVSSLGRLSALSPGKYPALIATYVDAANQAALSELCKTYNCAIV
ncbi:cellular apoptosis susceptibility protein, putative / importin-alpha re-exporter [Wolffia australiana]